MEFRFDPNYRARLLALPRVLARGGAAAEGPSSRVRGGRQDFREHRPYQPGDDPRDLDWGAWLRLGRLFSRTFERAEAPLALVLLDRSASMGPAGGAKDRVAREVAGGLVAAALQAKCPAALGVLAEGGPVTLGTWRSHRRLDEVLSLLEGLGAPDGPTHLGRAGFLPPAPAEGRATFLLSDFLCEPLPAEAAVAASRGRGSGAWLQIATRSERTPRLKDGAVLADVESDATLVVGDAAALARAYDRAFAAHDAAVRELASRHGLLSVAVSDEEAFERAVQRAYGLRGVGGGGR